jgi:hypothetical protein
MSKSTATILLELLKKVPDTKKLGILLDPKNLIFLLETYGYDKKSVSNELKNGKRPGEFLLDLLEKEPDSEILFSKLPVEEQKKWTPKPISPVQNKSNSNEQVKEGTANLNRSLEKPRGQNGFKYYALIILIILQVGTVTVPAMMLTGFVPNLLPSLELGLLISVVGGGVGGCLYDTKKLLSSIKGGIIGAVYGFSTFFAIYYYTLHRTSIIRLELAIPVLLGAIPPILLFILFKKISELNRSNQNKKTKNEN